MKISKIFTKIFISLALILTFSPAFAEEAPMRIVGTKPAILATPQQPAYIFKSGSKAIDKHILLQRIVLSTKAKTNIIEKLDAVESDINPPEAINTNLPAAVNLYMDKVPVLDQGMHGTCVTFATTAALDAAYGKGDYISQLCNLSLGTYLESISGGSYPSGWDGSYNEVVLQQIKSYGIMSIKYQTDPEIGCAGVTEYPTYDAYYVGNSLAPEKFAQYSEDIMANMSSVSHLKIKDAFTKNVNMQTVLIKVKQALANQHRVIASFLLDDKDGNVGAFGTHKATNDSWVLTPRIFRHFRSDIIDAGHAIIIIGYDDNMVIHQGKKTHKGAFILRNSWGPLSGDQGNYYMSYDYFRTLVGEVVEVVPTPAVTN